MGSLMAGWDSHTLDPKLVTRKRNRSLTKEEIAAYWKTKKKIEEEHLRAISNLPDTTQASKYMELEKKCKESSKVMPPTAKDSLDTDVDTSLQQLIMKSGLWTKSNWAFLNEPPVIETASNKYASQFHVLAWDRQDCTPAMELVLSLI